MLPKSKMKVNFTAKPTSAQNSIVRSLVERKILLQKADKLLKDVQAMFKNEPELFSNKLDVQNVLKHFDDSNDSDNIIKETVGVVRSTDFRDIVFPIHFATYLGDVEMVRFILEKDHHSGYRKSAITSRHPMHLAACGDSLTILRCLYQCNINSVKEQDGFGKIPLHLSHNLEVTQFLLDKYPQGAKIKDKLGEIPLHSAACSHNTDALKLILKEYPQGCSILNKHNELPIHKAMWAISLFEAKDCAKTLLQETRFYGLFHNGCCYPGLKRDFSLPLWQQEKRTPWEQVFNEFEHAHMLYEGPESFPEDAAITFFQGINQYNILPHAIGKFPLRHIEFMIDSLNVPINFGENNKQNPVLLSIQNAAKPEELKYWTQYWMPLIAMLSS